MRRTILLSVCILAVTSAAFGSVITFSDLSGTTVPNGYAGFDWTNFDHMMGMLDPLASGGVVGPPTAAPSFVMNHAGQVASFGSTAAFTLNSIWLATNWSSQLHLEVVGLLDGTALHSMIVDLQSGQPQIVNFNWSGIDEVRFVPIAAASVAGGTQFAMTDVVINQAPAVPEPATLLLLVPSLGLLGNKLRRSHFGR
jgi:hypothetical protein